MNMLKKYNLQQYVFFGIVLILFLFIFQLNRIFPLCLDDWDYSFVYGETPYRRVSSIRDILVSQYNHYFLWGGRSVVHVIGQFLLMQKTWVADLLNSLAYVFCMFFMYKICNSGKMVNIPLFLFINLAFWFILPEFSFTVFWIIGSSNYLWGNFIRVLFLYPFCSYFLSDKKNQYKNNLGKDVLFFIAGVIAGWTNENTAFAMIFLLVLLIVYLKLSKIKIPRYFIIGAAGACIGYLIMVAAPGNYNRMITTTGDSSLSFNLILHRLYYILSSNYIKIAVLGVTYIILFYYGYILNHRTITKRLILSSIFFLSGIISILVMVASPAFPMTVWTGIYAYFIIAFGLIIVSFDFYKYRLFSLIIAFGLIVAFVIDYVYLYKRISLFADALQERVTAIQIQKNQGVEDVKINKHIEVENLFSIYWDITEYPDRWQNAAYLKYFNIKSIVYEKEEKTAKKSAN